jgi:hypothetical protein
MLIVSVFFDNFSAPVGQTAAQTPHAVQWELKEISAMSDSEDGI